MNFPLGTGQEVNVSLCHQGIRLQVAACRGGLAVDITDPEIAKQIAVELFYLARQMRKSVAGRDSNPKL